MSTLVAFLLSGGAVVSGVLFVIFKGLLGGTVSHLWKRYLDRKARAHEGSRCTHSPDGSR